MKCKILVATEPDELENAINEFIKDKENARVSLSVQERYRWTACVLYDRCYADSMI